MKQEDEIKILEPTVTRNSIGEKVVGYEYVSTTFNANVQPNNSYIQMKMYGMVSGKSLKFYTTEELPEDFEENHLEIEGSEFRIINLDHFKGHYKVIVEKVDI